MTTHNTAGSPLGLLGGAVRAQGSDTGAIQGDDALTVGGLRRAQHNVAVVLLQLPGDDGGACV
jgi:hypothetical protein